jgi:hypothetical protein
MLWPLARLMVGTRTLTANFVNSFAKRQLVALHFHSWLEVLKVMFAICQLMVPKQSHARVPRCGTLTVHLQLCPPPPLQQQLSPSMTVGSGSKIKHSPKMMRYLVLI